MAAADLAHTVVDAVRKLTREKRDVKREVDWELAIRIPPLASNMHLKISVITGSES